MLRLASLDAAGLAAGLRPGMTLAEARAIHPGFGVTEIDRDKDRAALAVCADAAQRFTPLVAYDGNDGLLLDITGCAHLFGGETGIMQGTVRAMRRFGLTARAAVSTTPESARAFSRFSGGGIVPAGREGELASGLPIAALEMGRETATAMSRAGFRTLNDLATRPSSILTARFGSDLITRLKGILGQNDRRIIPLRPLPDIMSECHFPDPLTATERLMAALGRLAKDVCAALERRGEGGRRFRAEFYRADGAVSRIGIETGAPVRDPKVLLRLLRLKIDALADPLDPGFGFDAIRLSVLLSEAMTLHQEHLIHTQEPEDGAVVELVDRLVARFGRDNVQRFVAHDTHDPVRATKLVPHNAANVSAPMPALVQGEPPARPLTLFDKPQAIEAIAEVPDGPPIRFRWRRVLHEVARAEGPERIAPEWWQPEAALPGIRDYYRVEDANGQRFWLFREGFYAPGAQARWYVHGLFA